MAVWQQNDGVTANAAAWRSQGGLDSGLRLENQVNI
jgi:hypothetical protein